MESIEQVLKKVRESSYYLNLGFIYENLNKRKEAKEVYVHGLKRSPDSKKLQEFYKNLVSVDRIKNEADTYFTGGKYNEAIESYQKLI